MGNFSARELVTAAVVITLIVFAMSGFDYDRMVREIGRAIIGFVGFGVLYLGIAAWSRYQASRAALKPPPGGADGSSRERRP